MKAIDLFCGLGGWTEGLLAMIAIGVLRLCVPTWERIVGRKLSMEDDEEPPEEDKRRPGC